MGVRSIELGEMRVIFWAGALDMAGRRDASATLGLAMRERGFEPGIHAAGEVMEIGVAFLGEEGAGAGGAATGFAMDDEGDVTGDFF